MATKPEGLPMSGFCFWPSSINDSHQYCKKEDCTCNCHQEK